KNGKQIVVTALEHSAVRPFWLSNDAVVDLLHHYGINVVRSKSAMTVEEAVKAADELGYPAVMKLMSATIIHKTEVGGVILDLRSQIEAKKAFMQIKERLINLKRENEMQGVILQQMIPEGVEVIVGVTQDPSFGSLVMFGMGGIYTELFRDVTFRIHPLTDVDTQEMVRSIKAYQLLEGWRGSKPSDTGALEELLLRVSAMIEDLPQIVELDLNPVKVMEQGKGYVVVDARIMVS
ncbi:MAG: acetate--CoA ligase family protein, partial [Chloroflexota bacterium]